MHFNESQSPTTSVGSEFAGVLKHAVVGVGRKRKGNLCFREI